jgi:subtilisin family serine protease
VELDYSATPKAQAIGMSIKGLSPESAQFLSLCRQADTLKNRSARKAAQAQLRERYGVQRGKVSAIVELAEGHNPQELKDYGVSVGSEAGGIFTVRIPVKRFAELAESGICKSIDVGRKMTTMLDNVRGNLGIDEIHAGLNLPHGYDGSGVVVGVIDIGLQFCHPSFYDTTGTELRVKRVWNQKDTLGTAPSGYDYGSEYTTEAQMMAVFTDDTTETHGTHVTGIAAGCGAPSGNGTAYRGIAPGADIVLVPCMMTGPSILDGINYIHDYAHSVGKPCVINMSLGLVDGPHDGTSAEDRYVTSFVQQHPDSFALVCSAGNSGNNNIHISKQFTTSDTMLTTRLTKQIYLSSDPDSWVDIWCGGIFRVSLTLIDPVSQTQEDFTGFFTTGVDTLIETYLITNSNDSLRCRFYLCQKDSYNQSYHVYVKVENNTVVLHNKQLILTVMCDTTATLHAWCGQFTFKHSNLVAESVEGDSQCTLDGIGSNTDAVISVGSYSTRKSYTSFTGTSFTENTIVGDISYFSSLGPTRDGRVKPDIAAPGQVLMAPYNQYASASYNIYDTTQWNGQINYYGSLMGTSMSSPVVTGIVALWMQHNPSLGTDSVRAIVHGTARNDRFTGSLADNPSNVWGYGKVNAYGGLPVNTTLWLVNAYGQDDLYGKIMDDCLYEIGN